jgi:hypothetical protein
MGLHGSRLTLYPGMEFFNSIAWHGNCLSASVRFCKSVYQCHIESMVSVPE